MSEHIADIRIPVPSETHLSFAKFAPAFDTFMQVCNVAPPSVMALALSAQKVMKGCDSVVQMISTGLQEDDLKMRPLKMLFCQEFSQAVSHVMDDIRAFDGMNLKTLVSRDVKSLNTCIHVFLGSNKPVGKIMESIQSAKDYCKDRASVLVVEKLESLKNNLVVGTFYWSLLKPEDTPSPVFLPFKIVATELYDKMCEDKVKLGLEEFAKLPSVVDSPLLLDAHTQVHFSK